MKKHFKYYYSPPPPPQLGNFSVCPPFTKILNETLVAKVTVISGGLIHAT